MPIHKTVEKLIAVVATAHETAKKADMFHTHNNFLCNCNKLSNLYLGNTKFQYNSVMGNNFHDFFREILAVLYVVCKGIKSLERRCWKFISKNLHDVIVDTR